MTILDHVLADPRPSLDQSGCQEQFRTYQEALKCLLSNSTNVFSIPAGAGSGKTRTLISIITGLLRHGVPADIIEGISFTNASADDFQGRLIKQLVILSNEPEETIRVENLTFSTIHKHAIDLLKKLSPHVAGVAYYFEDSDTSTVNSEAANHKNAASAEEEIKQKAMKLSLYSSAVFNDKDVDMLQPLLPFMKQDEMETRFILDDLGATNHQHEAQRFICEEMMSDAGLGAFTNIDDTNPDYCIAVITDALLRLHMETGDFSADEIRQRYGLPKYLLVDESQDLDLIQLLYLRALAINGVSIVMVGDPRQTLYEFRNAVSEWPFDPDFLEALFYGTDVLIQVSPSPLLTNYRSRKEIIDLAEAISESMVEHSTQSISKNIQPIYDPEASVNPSHCYLTADDVHDKEKLTTAVSVIIGAKTDQLDILLPKKKSSVPAPVSGPLARLVKSDTRDANEQTDERFRALKNRLQYLQLPNVCGGDNLPEIKTALQTLYERVSNPNSHETAAILTKNGQKPEDFRMLEAIIGDRFPQIKNSNELRFRQINTEKNAPLSNYWFFDSHLIATQEVPFTSLLIGSAIHYFFSWDKKASDEVNLTVGKPLNMIAIESTKERVIESNKRYKPEQSIKIELQPYLDGLLQQSEQFFPGIPETTLVQQRDAILRMMARFVYDVLVQYAILLWESFEGRNFSFQPCRFNSVCTMMNKTRNLPQVRNLNETKRFFKTFWQAVSKTPFQYQHDEQQLLNTVGISTEWMTVGTNLLNFPEEIAAWADQQERERKVLSPEIANRMEDFIKNRETIHEQFSNLYHHKTRKYLRQIAKKIGSLIRLDPAGDPTNILIVAYEEYRDARQKARTNTWVADRSNKYMGLLEDMQAGMRDINLQSVPKPSDKDDGIPTIELSTIHGSKGLEWDHVVLIFPSASSKDSQSTFKSARDLLYVAITRAVRTLTIIVPTDKNYKDSPTVTGMVAARHLLHEYARDKELYSRILQYDDLRPEQKEEHSHGMPEVELQTSHSELEKALTCRLHHYIQHNRNLSSMVPLTAPSYSFFFHSAMSSICAGLIGQRIPIPNDPIAEIVNVINSLATQSNLTEEDVYKTLMANVHSHLNELMQSMIPLYFLSGGKEFYEVMEYYTFAFAKQLSSIMVGSKLFENLVLARNMRDHKIWIEKPIKDVLRDTEDGLDYYYPVIGIPDIKIQGPIINFVCDYKTVETSYDESGLSDETLNQISTKTYTQINLYQGLEHAEECSNFLAEVIYVADISLFEGQTIPEGLPGLPSFNNNARYRVKGNYGAAVILWTDSFDESRFIETRQDIADLRFNANDNLACPNVRTFFSSPLVGVHAEERVSHDTCLHCPSSVHCQKSLKEEH